jgi:HK97 family phage portal protein
MGLRDFLHRVSPAGLIEDMQARAAASFTVLPFEDNIRGVFPTRYPQGNWRTPSVREALGVPAILRCVTLIANTAGALSMNAYDDGVKVSAKARPRIVVRPNPLSKPRDFWRDTAYWKALYGESWWFVAKRDADGLAQSLVPVPPHEVKVEPDPKDRLRPFIEWNGQRRAREDMILDKLLPDPNDPYRGVGPLQLCGAAVSAAVESQEWAANFYSEGGYGSVWAKPEIPFESEDDAKKFKDAWTSNPPNTPLLLEGIEAVGQFQVNEHGSQMLGTRVHNFGEAALMFGIPGRMIEYVQSGASLTYANVGDIFDEFVKVCLWPNYLEGSEQDMTDLLPRSWLAEFDVDRFTRPDAKTRMEIHAIAITAGIYDAEYAKQLEGITPGSIETAPVPASPPAAIPAVIEARAAAPEPVRCTAVRTIRSAAGVPQLRPCGKLLAEAGPYVGKCPRCKSEYGVAA